VCIYWDRSWSVAVKLGTQIQQGMYSQVGSAVSDELSERVLEGLVIAGRHELMCRQSWNIWTNSSARLCGDAGHLFHAMSTLMIVTTHRSGYRPQQSQSPGVEAVHHRPSQLYMPVLRGAFQTDAILAIPNYPASLSRFPWMSSLTQLWYTQNEWTRTLYGEYQWGIQQQRHKTHFDRLQAGSVPSTNY